MYPTVTVTQQGRAPIYLTVVDPIVIGRECEGLLLADEKISRQHLRLSPGTTGVIVLDLRSTNGSYIDRVRIEGETVLTPGSTLVLGDTTIRVEPAPTPPASMHTTTRDVGGTIVATLRPDNTEDVLDPRPAVPLVAAPPPTAAPPAPTAPAPPVSTAAPVPDVTPTVMPSPVSNETRRTSIDELAASFSGHPISLPTRSADDTVTIMFSDIESSTEIALGMGDQRWYEVLTAHNRLVEQRVAAHAGFIVKNQGDGFMITFNSARRAIICASEIQKGLYSQAVEDPNNAVRVRIGLHTGEAIRQDTGDLFGRHVIIAARVGAMAAGGEILVSSIVREIASARGDLHFGDGRLVELKGVGEQQVYPVLWGADLPPS